MILYEFTYTTLANTLTLEEKKSLTDYLESEESLQGWAPGWELDIEDIIGRSKGEQWEYTCVIRGSYLVGYL